MKLQAVVLKVEQCKPISFIPEDQVRANELNYLSVQICAPPSNELLS
jgi:hypothetical protein